MEGRGKKEVRTAQFGGKVDAEADVRHLTLGGEVHVERLEDLDERVHRLGGEARHADAVLEVVRHALPRLSVRACVRVYAFVCECGEM